MPAVTTIGDDAFAKCTNLKKVTIGKGLKKIGKRAFYKDKSLKYFKIKSSKLTSVDNKAFRGVNVKKVKFECPKGKKKAYGKIFKKGK